MIDIRPPFMVKFTIKGGVNGEGDHIYSGCRQCGSGFYAYIRAPESVQGKEAQEIKWAGGVRVIEGSRWFCGQQRVRRIYCCEPSVRLSYIKKGSIINVGVTNPVSQHFS